VLEPELVGEPDDEPTHRPRREERGATLGVSEPGQVHRDHVGVLSEPVPHLAEGEQALGPRAEEECVVVTLRALGEPDPEAVDRPELWLEASSR
jgi:hypothetical protein